MSKQENINNEKLAKRLYKVYLDNPENYRPSFPRHLSFLEIVINKRVLITKKNEPDKKFLPSDCSVFGTKAVSISEVVVPVYLYSNS